MSEKQYRAAKYIRLSYSDDKSVESDSVTNQRRQLDSYIESQSDIEAVSEWIDDGVSGILFDRPAFKEMMAEIKSGNINCVIVKDLSRLGREYIETGNYLRRIFPSYGVRFIALNDNIDTLKDSGDDLVVSVKSIVNDAYCRDISVKTRSALNIKRENGDFVGACPVYGYRKAENDRNQLVVDDYPAGIVHDIFRMKIDGMSALKIADTLNSLGVLSPLEYKKDRGLPHPTGGYADKDGAKWSAHTIIRILTDETYTGTLVQGRQGRFNYKIREIIDKPKSEWKRTENAHEHIIKPQDFDLAQRIMRLDTRTAPGGDSVYLFSGILICGCCGARMTRKAVPYKGIKYHYYYCPTTKKRGCIGAATLKEAELHEYVLECVKTQVNNIATLDSILAGSDGQKAAVALAKQYAAQIAENERQIEKAAGIKSTLYENMVTRLITKDDYKAMKAQYTADEARFIAVTDSFDSLDGDGGILLPLKNIISESYALDISRKCRAVQQQNIAEGRYVGRLAPYGYKKAPDDCRRLVVNEETAPVVRQIFELTLDGFSTHEIAHRLSKENTPTPARYNYDKGHDKSKTQLNVPYWKPSAVKNILSDRVYIGDMVQGKTRTVNGKQINIDPSEWVCVPNTHEAIITRDIFDSVQMQRQEIHERAMEIYRGSTPYSVNVFKGKIACSVCGHPLKRKRQNKDGTYWFRCDSKWKYGKDACTIIAVREADLKRDILTILHTQAEAILGRYISFEQAAAAPDNSAAELREINQKLDKDGRMLRSLYESMVSGLISKDEFVEMKARYEDNIAALSRQADEIRGRKYAVKARVNEYRDLADAVTAAVHDDKLTIEIIDRLIQEIRVHADKTFDVLYKFKNEFEGVRRVG